MAKPFKAVLDHLHQVLTPANNGPTDGQLLVRFLTSRDEGSFATLVRRHGPMVLGVCRRLLRHEQDAEDCFQATFLVLARKAAVVMRESVGSFLYGVAYRIALEAKAINARRRAREKQVQEMPQHEVMPAEVQDWRPWLDRELSLLPEHYRAVLVVCDLQGRSRKEAAHHLGLSEGTVSSRLARGRCLLAKRLSRHGLALSASALTATLAESAQVPVPLVFATVKAALQTVAISSTVEVLVKGALRAMFMAKLKLVLGAVMVLSAFAVGGLVYRASGQSAPPAAEQKPDNDPQSELEALRRENELLKLNLEVLLEKVRAQAAPRQHKIVVTSPRAKDVIITQQYVCQIHAYRHINVRALQNASIEEVPVKEGQTVKKSDVLFKLDPARYKAKYEAELADVQIAQIEYDNTKKQYENKVVSSQEVAIYQAKLNKALARAKLAKTELDFTVVRAPFDGIVGRLQEQVGSPVKEGDVLTTLSDNSVIWVYFNVPEARYLEHKAARDQEREDPKIELVLANGSKFPKLGRIGAIDAKFNSQTGNVPFRADFENPDRLLRHGQTGNVLIHRTLHNAIVIPQRAVFEIMDRRYVWVVGKDGVVHQREIVIQNELEDIFVIKRGLDVNDRIVVEGVRQVKGGEKVEYQFRPPDGAVRNQKNHAK
jgi:membrane fusion protein (multidrug efflux system)